MLKLAMLLDNRDLALHLLSNWTFDADRLDVLDRFRISANAVYPFLAGGRTCFLRFAPAEEKATDSVRAELDFLAYLRAKGYPAMEVLPTRDGSELVDPETPWGRYVAVAFRRAPGERMDSLEPTRPRVFALGRSLGWMHRLSCGYRTDGPRRPDWRERLDWTREVLAACAAPPEALEEARILESFFGNLPVDPGTFGLVHYDFEPDNLFYDETTGLCTPIDYDDAVHHWFAMDLAQALASLEDEWPDAPRDELRTGFLDGYRSERAVDDRMLALLPVFRRPLQRRQILQETQ